MFYLIIESCAWVYWFDLPKTRIGGLGGVGGIGVFHVVYIHRWTIICQYIIFNDDTIDEVDRVTINNEQLKHFLLIIKYPIETMANQKCSHC